MPADGPLLSDDPLATDEVSGGTPLPMAWASGELG
jgi:hypothetical protein